MRKPVVQALLFLGLFLQAGCNRGADSASTPNTPTLAPATATAPKASGFTLADPTLARHISFAHVTNGTLLVSRQSGLPHAVAPMDTTGVLLDWVLSWTPDQTRLLVVAGGVGSGTPPAWILTLPANRLTPLSSDAVADGCTRSCVWIADRSLADG